MGDIADGILNGDFDEVTGEYLGEGQGFPRTMHREPNALFGVKNYLRKKGFDNWGNIVVAYNKEVLKLGELSTDKIAIEIQKDFGAFVKFVNKK